MENLHYDFQTDRAARLAHRSAIVGVVSSGDLEIFLERAEFDGRCAVDVATAAKGFADLWTAVLADFVARWPAGGLRITINDGGARPDTVALRLAQGIALIGRPNDD